LFFFETLRLLTILVLLLLGLYRFSQPKWSGICSNIHRNDSALTTANNFNYTTGPFENYDSNNISKKFLTRLDWNINDNNQLTARCHNSSADNLISNSQSMEIEELVH
jgi:hypothetical protein